jgi:hypothetical protein
MAKRNAMATNTATPTVSHAQRPTVSITDDCKIHPLTLGGVIARVRTRTRQKLNRPLKSILVQTGQ